MEYVCTYALDAYFSNIYSFIWKSYILLMSETYFRFNKKINLQAEMSSISLFFKYSF